MADHAAPAPDRPAPTGLGDEAAPSPNTPAPPTTIDSTFRNGSLTATGIVAAFSLGFLTRWAGTPGAWSYSDVAGLVLILTGIALQLKSMMDFLDVESLQIANYQRGVRLFKIGIAATALGVVVGVFAELTGLGGQLLRS